MTSDVTQLGLLFDRWCMFLVRHADMKWVGPDMMEDHTAQMKDVSDHLNLLRRDRLDVLLMLSRHYSFLFFQSTYVWRHSVSYILKSGSRLHQIKLNNILVFRYIILPQTIQFVILIMKQLSHSLSCWCLSSSIAPQRMCCNWQRRERWLWQREHAFSDFLTVISTLVQKLLYPLDESTNSGWRSLSTEQLRAARFDDIRLFGSEGEGFTITNIDRPVRSPGNHVNL